MKKPLFVSLATAVALLGMHFSMTTAVDLRWMFLGVAAIFGYRKVFK